MPKKDTRLKLATWVVGAYVVLATYTIWAIKAYNGDPIHWLFVALAVLITVAGAMVVFGTKRMSSAIEMVIQLRGLAQEARKMKEDDDRT